MMDKSDKRSIGRALRNVGTASVWHGVVERVDNRPKNIKMDTDTIKRIAENVHKNSPFRNGLDVDEDYHCKCLSCGRIVLCGPACCDNFKSQYMADNGE